MIISSCPTASRIRHASRGCLMAHHRRREINVLANVKLTTNHTIPRTASQFTNPMTIIQYQASCCPASSINVNTTATVRLGSRKGLIKSTIRQNHRRSIFVLNYELLSTPPLVRQNVYISGYVEKIVACVPSMCNFYHQFGNYGPCSYSLPILNYSKRIVQVPL